MANVNFIGNDSSRGIFQPIKIINVYLLGKLNKICNKNQK